jgi:hypothetical protein
MCGISIKSGQLNILEIKIAGNSELQAAYDQGSHGAKQYHL